jgi:acetyl esterase/lipase
MNNTKTIYRSCRPGLLAALSGLLLAAAALQGQTTVVRLYPGVAPGSEKWTQKEIWYPFGKASTKAVRNVVEPNITAYLPSPETATGTGVVVAPGGAFRMLVYEGEGSLIAEWLQRHGVAAFVLKYRIADSGTEEEYAKAQAQRTAQAAGGRGAPGGSGGGGRGAQAQSASAAPANNENQIRAMGAADGLRAIEVVREHAAEWHLDPAKVGIMGFSAGGYVAVQAGLEHTAANRPAFVAAIYACCENAANIKVPEDAPPYFFLHASNDPVSASSPSLFLAFKAANKSAELHTYAAGGHGFATSKQGLPSDKWIELYADWMRSLKFMN